MSFLKDALGFEMLHTKDLWNRIKKDPKRLVLGVDPWSTKAWNTVLNRDDKPLVDQMGGAYDGHTLSIGGEGGVYKRAREAGINTGPGLNMQRGAHVIAALFAGNGLGNAAGNVMGSAGSAGSAGAGSSGAGMSPYGPYASGYQFAPGSSFSGAEGAGGAAGGGGTWGGMDWTDPSTYTRFAGNSQQQQQQPQQEQDSLLKRRLIEQERARQLAEAMAAAQTRGWT